MPSACHTTSAPPSTPHYPADRAFIVKFCDELPGTTTSPLGTVEHLVSGRQAAFASMEELGAAIARCQNGAAAPGSPS